jgi:hypothetical protein
MSLRPTVSPIHLRHRAAFGSVDVSVVVIFGGQVVGRPSIFHIARGGRARFVHFARALISGFGLALARARLQMIELKEHFAAANMLADLRVDGDQALFLSVKGELDGLPLDCSKQVVQ